MRTVLLASLRTHARRYVASVVAVVIGVSFVVVTSRAVLGRQGGAGRRGRAPLRRRRLVVSDLGTDDAATIVRRAESAGDDAVDHRRRDVAGHLRRRGARPAGHRRAPRRGRLAALAGAARGPLAAAGRARPSPTSTRPSRPALGVGDTDPHRLGQPGARRRRSSAWSTPRRLDRRRALPPVVAAAALVPDVLHRHRGLRRAAAPPRPPAAPAPLVRATAAVRAGAAGPADPRRRRRRDAAAGLRRDRALRLGAGHRQHLLDPVRPAHPRPRAAALRGRDPPPAAALDPPRGARPRRRRLGCSASPSGTALGHGLVALARTQMAAGTLGSSWAPPTLVRRGGRGRGARHRRSRPGCRRARWSGSARSPRCAPTPASTCAPRRTGAHRDRPARGARRRPRCSRWRSPQHQRAGDAGRRHGVLHRRAGARPVAGARAGPRRRRARRAAAALGSPPATPCATPGVPPPRRRRCWSASR